MEISGKPPFNLKHANLAIRPARRGGVMVRPSEKLTDHRDEFMMADAQGVSSDQSGQDFSSVIKHACAEISSCFGWQSEYPFA